MRFGTFSFGSVEIDDVTYRYDVVIDGDTAQKRKKKPSKHFRSPSGHTPLSVAEDIPWECSRLIVGTGVSGALPIMHEVEHAARVRHVKLVPLPTPAAIRELAKGARGTNAILHVTC
jgi:hypothetical protein